MTFFCSAANSFSLSLRFLSLFRRSGGRSDGSSRLASSFTASRDVEDPPQDRDDRVLVAREGLGEVREGGHARGLGHVGQGLGLGDRRGHLVACQDFERLFDGHGVAVERDLFDDGQGPVADALLGLFERLAADADLGLLLRGRHGGCRHAGLLLHLQDFAEAVVQARQLGEFLIGGGLAVLDQYLELGRLRDVRPAWRVAALVRPTVVRLGPVHDRLAQLVAAGVDRERVIYDGLLDVGELLPVGDDARRVFFVGLGHQAHLAEAVVVARL
jgi:hypothetical protein